ncbi:MAG: PKD domain-containing protein [Saprospirales bacterium]|nr:PKD domain-containing protein [Saprospirales bacterium]
MPGYPGRADSRFPAVILYGLPQLASHFCKQLCWGSSFFWDFGDGNTSGAFQPTHAYALPGSYTVTLIATKNNYDAEGNPLCCCADTATAIVVIDPLPGPDIYCISTLCAGDSSKYWTDATNCGSYIWTVLDENGNPWPFTGQGTDTISVHWGNGPTGTITLEVMGCDNAYCSQPVSVTVPIISPTVGINGPIIVCENSSATYTVPKWLSVLYNWQVIGGTILSGQGTNVVTIQWGAAPGPGQIKLDYASSFLGGLPGHGEGDCAGSAILDVGIKPMFSVAGPPPVVCANTMSTFTATAFPSSSYTWTVTPAVSFTGQNSNTLVVTWDAGPGIFTVTAVPNTPSDYCNAQVSKVVRVVETPKPTGITGPVEICPGGTDVYFGQSAQSGMGFQWTVVGGTPASFIGNPLNVTWNASGPYGLALQQFSLNAPGCFSDPIQYTVTPKLLVGPLAITGPNACINTVQSYSASPAQHPSATYQWTVVPASLGSIISGQGTPNVQVQWNNTPGPVSLQLQLELCGIQQTVSLARTLNPAPPPIITQNGILCPGVPATLDAGPGYTGYSWSTSAMTQTTSITTGGTYLVTVTSSGGCTSVGSFQATALPGPTAFISTGNPTTLCSNPPNNNGTVTISAINGPGYTFAWYRNGSSLGLPAAQSSYTHTNTQTPATFTYWVIVTDANGCMNQSNTITVQQVSCQGGGNGGCIPANHNLSFTSSNPTPNCNTVNFTVTKSNNVTVTGWNFGDPFSNTNTGILPNAQHKYTKAGCYNVVVTATVPSLPIFAGGTCTITRNAQVCVPIAAGFSYAASCQTVSFTDQTTYLTGSNPTTWQWTFGDASTSNVQNPVHTYATGGTYPVTLVVTNAAGCLDSITIQVTVPNAPTPTLSANPSPACAGDPVQFSATAPGAISWLWNFGDGITNGGPMPAHTYLTAGTYTVILTVVDAQGCQGVDSISIIVHPNPPAAPITWSPSLTVCAGETVTLNAPTGTGYMYLWSGGQLTPSIQVTTSGTYSVLITDANGCKYRPDSVTVTVLPLPTASITGPHHICDAGCVKLTASSGYLYTYQWLDASNTPIAGETYPTIELCDYNLLPGYAVVVTDANGCSAVSSVFTVSLAVSPAFSITVAPDSCEGTPATLTINPVQPDVVYSWSNGGTGTSITVVQAGIYTAVGRDTLTGCSSSASAEIYPLPDLCLVPAGCYDVCKPDTICGPPGLAAYQWNLSGIPIPGATDSCLVITQDGTYSLTGTTPYGCSLTSDSLMLEAVSCEACDKLVISAEPSTEAPCCWTLSYSNEYGELFGFEIFTNDADLNFDLSSLSTSLDVFSISTHAIGLVNSQTGDPLPMDKLDDFLTFCLENVVNSPQQIIIQWYDFDFKVVCADTLLLECPIEPECLYLVSDSIYCDSKEVFYQFTVCNPVDAAFPVKYIELQPATPPGVVVTPNAIDETANPILAGECRTYTVMLSGPFLPGKEFCFSLSAHDDIPEELDTTMCCMLDTMYCVIIPDCEPCDDIGVENWETVSEGNGKCCYTISLFNNYDPNYFDGVSLCMLSPNTAMTITNPFGSGWFTTSYTPTVIDLDVGPPIGAYIPMGLVTLPQICVETDGAPPQLLEIKWINADSVVCRDTIALECEPPCGYMTDTEVICNPDGTGGFLISGLIKNTSAYIMNDADIIFTSPLGLSAYNTSLVLGALAPGGTQPFTLTVGNPAQAGDTVCFTAGLHVVNDDAEHLLCCNFHQCFVLPDCTIGPGTGAKLWLYPNPSNGEVFAQYTAGWNSPVRVRIYDMLGRHLSDREYPEAVGQEKLPLQLGILPKGIYTIILESEGKRWVEKLIID